MARGLQEPRRVFHEPRNGRLVRRDECSEDLSHVAYAAPLIARKEVDPTLVDDGRSTLRLHSELEFSKLRFIEPCQVFDVERR